VKKIVLFLLIALVLLVSCNQDEIHVHKFDEGTITTAPTCTTEGVKTFKCQCGETKTEEVPALGHDKEDVEAKAATCTEKGWKAYEKCKREGCDYTTYEEIAATGHTEGTPVTTAATCTAAGSTVVKCTVCDAVISTTPIEKLEHTSDAGVVTTEPTCTEEGEKTFSCTVCNTVLSTEKVDANGHSYGDLKTTAATCEKDGEEYKVCSVCNDKKVERTLTKLDHDFKGTETIVQQATCTGKGSKTIKCTRCEKTKTEEIVAKGHTEGTPVTTAATCTAAGSTVVKCTVCNATISTTSIPQLAHEFEDTGTVKSEATCKAAKVVTYKCKNCTYTEDRSEGDKDSTNHTGNTEWRVTTAATYFAKGTETEYCKDCGVSLGNTRETDFKALTGFWEGTATYDGGITTTVTCSFADGKMIYGEGMDGYYMESSAYDYTVSSSGITYTAEENRSITLSKVSEGANNTGAVGDEITLSGGEANIELTRKTTTAHTHTYAESWEPVEIKDGDYITGVGHSKKMLCTEHTTFDLAGMHEYSDSGVCTLCGAERYYEITRQVTEEGGASSGAFCFVKKDNSFTLPGENTVIYTLNDTTTTYHGGDTYTPTGNILITDVAYANVSASDKAKYSAILSTHVHSFNDGTVTTVATCTTEGVKTKTCACGATTTESLGKDATNHVGDTEWKVATTADEAKYFTEGTETEYCKACNATIGNTRKYFKDLTGFWEGTANYNNTLMTFTFSFADGKLTTGSVMNGVYGEAEPYSYTVSSTGITTEGDDNPNFSFVSEDGEKITISINSVNIELERKTTTAHTHTYKTGYEVVETTDDNGNITHPDGHTHETSCTVHSVFKAYEEHTFSSGTCTVCGAKYYEIWQGDSISKSTLCYVRDGSTYTLPGESTVTYTLNDSTTTYQGGAIYTPSGNIFITDVAYSTLPTDWQSDYTVLSTYVAPAYTVGGTVELGTYPGNYAISSLADQPIKWKVLSVDTANSRMLVISENILIEEMTFDGDSNDYSDSDIRTYLNGDFITTYGLSNVSINVDVTSNIEETTVGSGTDKVFLLSKTEAENTSYFANDTARVAKYNGTAVYWWLRTPSSSYNIYAVSTSGTFSGYNSVYYVKGVRPAMWVSF
jgi:hypothetical protein